MKSWIRQILIGFIRFYQIGISPLLPPRCRFYPTCSQYTLEALKIHGTTKGTWLGVKRICKCHPWGGSGIDLVPLPKDYWQRLHYTFIAPTDVLKKRVPFI